MALDNNNQAPWWQPGLILFSKLSGLIAGPILIAVFLGKMLDRKFATEPWFFLGLTGLAFVFSIFAILYQYTSELRRIEREDKEKKVNKNS